MNFTFMVGDIVEIKDEGPVQYVLVKGFDPQGKSFRIWWADPLIDGRPRVSMRIRTYSNKMVRLGRPEEEAERKRVSEEYAMKRRLVAIRKKNDLEFKRLKKEGKKVQLSMKPRNWR